MTTKGKPPVTGTSDAVPAGKSSSGEIADFLSLAKKPASGAARGRIIFALDATMSRQPTWDQACHLQAEMFAETEKIGGLSVKLAFFRGFGECKASAWADDANRLAGLMSGIDCRGGHTQIGKILTLARQEAGKGRVNALIFVGDCMEEDADDLCAKAGELGLLGVPVFLFQEGHDASATAVFKEIARLTKGAHCAFDAGSALQLGDLLKAVAAYASGGAAALSALQKRGNTGAQRLIEQMT